MPTDEALLQQANDAKASGNASFSAGDLDAAIASYSSGLVACDRLPAPPAALKAALLGNRAMCELKRMRLRPAIEDCDAALQLDPEASLRTKVLFRRAKASFLLANLPGGKATEQNDLLQSSAKDLLEVLAMDGKNAEAKQLLTAVRAQHKSSSASASSPVAKICDQLKRDEGDATHNVKLLLGLIDNDLTNASMELGRVGGVESLLHLAESTNDKTAILAVQCLSQCGSHPAFVRAHLADTAQASIADLIDKQTASATSDLVISLLAVLVRILLHVDRDNPHVDITGTTKVDSTAILRACNAALRFDDRSIVRAVLDVLSTWTVGKDRLSMIRASLAGTVDPTLPKPVSQADIRAMTPQELAAHRKRETDQKTRDEAWAYERALLFVREGLPTLLQAATSCDDHTVRREITVVIGRILAGIESEDKIKEVVAPFLGPKKEADLGVVIEEVYNEDGDETKEVEEVEATPLSTMMERALITNALLLSKKDVGIWAFGSGWGSTSEDLEVMIDSGNPRAMCLASEVVSAAATLESAAGILTNLMKNGWMEKLILSGDRDIRSGAASAVAKIGLADKSTASDEGEIMALLQGACDLLEDKGEGERKADTKGKKESHTLRHFSSFATSSVERAIEMINYLVANTVVKDELAAGFQAPGASRTGLERLVEVSDLPKAGESLSGFGLATIFQNLAVTNLQLRKEAFEGKEVTMEQYDEMQRMGKTEEEKEMMDLERDTDTQEACNERIRKMAAANVPRALVTLVEGASEHTLEQLMLGMNRMATEVSVRGLMIQQGVLSCCIKVEKNEGPTDTDTMKKVSRLARHCIAKLLISTNPSLLTSAQRLGSIRPLIQLIRDIKASDLQHFEALLAITNIAGSGDDAKNRIASEKGLAPLHFCMFSDHEMVQRAATEAMCNLVPHKAMMDHLANAEHMKLWLAFASDYEEHYECSRAATGCLAMASQDESIALEIANSEKFGAVASSILESGRLEIMHRGLYTILNLMIHGGECRKKVESEGLVAFCKAYADSYHDKTNLEGYEFPEEERALLPVTIDLAKKIVEIGDQGS